MSQVLLEGTQAARELLCWMRKFTRNGFRIPDKGEVLTYRVSLVMERGADGKLYLRLE